MLRRPAQRPLSDSTATMLTLHRWCRNVMCRAPNATQVAFRSDWRYTQTWTGGMVAEWCFVSGSAGG